MLRGFVKNFFFCLFLIGYYFFFNKVRGIEIYCNYLLIEGCIIISFCKLIILILSLISGIYIFLFEICYFLRKFVKDIRVELLILI